MQHLDSSVRLKEEEIFQHAAELLPAERPSYLSVACADDPAIRARMERLLRLHEDRDFMAARAERTVSSSAESESLRWKPEQVGERIGNYKLLEQIGEGGFGIVWAAEQEKPVRRRVALKIIKLGMDTREVIARFEQERQALAMMDHPNIAKVHDASATPTGRPFFVMELVRGIKINEYCDKANLPTHERLRLFIAVCNAVQHAHQKGIIHRDLKPSNILVTLHDGKPVPKVIDFGVAKATQSQRLTDLTIYTQFEQMIGTPLYMSPEQAEMSGLDIDTRSDIYSLGVLLFELLVGRTPFDPQALMKAGYDEMRRVIREQEPQKPSTFLSTMAIEARTASARSRQTDSAKWIGQIRGDLDWIVMKCLEKDRTRRYETANGLAKDIERHLGNEPVQARPPSQVYRFRRFTQRNRLAFAAGSAVLAALIIGLAVSTGMFFKEMHTSERAVAAEKAQSQVAQFLKDMLKGVGPSVALGRDTKLLREVLDKTAERVGKDVKDQPAVEAELRNVLGQVYFELGDYDQADAMHGEALAIRRKLAGNMNAVVAESLGELALVLLVQGKLAQVQGKQAQAQGKLAKSETLFREALATQRKTLGNENSDVGSSLDNLATVLSSQGKLARAEAMYREALAMKRKLFRNDHPALAISLSNLAGVLQRQGKLIEAEAAQREALAMQRRLLGREHPDMAVSLNNLAVTLSAQGKVAEAESILREALAMQRKLLGSEHPVLANTLDNLARLLDRQGRLPDAEPMHREALAIQRKLGNEIPGMTTYGLAENLYRQGKYTQAEPLYREIVESDSVRLNVDDADRIGGIASLARVLTEWAWSERPGSAQLSADADGKGRLAQPGFRAAYERASEAERLLRECLATRLGGTLSGPDATQWRIEDVRSRLGGALLAMAVTDPDLSMQAAVSKFSEAESLLLEGNKGLDQLTSPGQKKYKRDALLRLVRLYQAWDKPDKVAEWQQKLAEFDNAEAKKAESEEKAVPPQP